MDLQTAIERAKSALEYRVRADEREIFTDGEFMTIKRQRLIGGRILADTEALQALREWKPEEHHIEVRPLTGKWDGQCSVCGKTYPQWVGSTPCCGGMAYVINHNPDGQPKDQELNSCDPPSKTMPGTMHYLKGSADGLEKLFEWTGDAWSTPGTGCETTPTDMHVLGWSYSRQVYEPESAPTGEGREE